MSPDDSFRQRLERVLIENFPDCIGLVSADRLSGGASQETYRLVMATSSGDRTLAMRRSAGGEYLERTPEHPGLDVEALLMRSARAAGVPEPEIYHVLTRDDALGNGFIMQWVEGEALGARILRSPAFEAVRPKLARECGRILARIHRIDLDATGLRNRLWQIPPADFVAQTWERYQRLETPQPMIDYSARWLQEHLPEDYESTLVHNDFRNGNLMLSPAGVVAVLDWEIAHIGDPMRDLGWICVNSWRFGGDKPVGGFGAYEELFQGYEEVSGKPVNPDHVRFWEVFGSFWWAVGCLKMAEHFRSGPDRSVERVAIGRRSSECQVDCVNLLIPGPVEPVEASLAFTSLDMPRSDELLCSVRDFLRDEVMGATRGRDHFLARVASNSLDIVLRELAVGPRHLRLERERLAALLAEDVEAPGDEADLMSLRWKLVQGLRDGSIALDKAGLQRHLRQTVVNQVAIDQPKYSGYKAAIH